MTKKITIIIVFFTVFLGYAQLDSLGFTQLRQRNVFFTNYLNSPVTFQYLLVKDFTQTGLYASIKNQKLSEKQTPNKVSYYGFNSNGVFTLKNKLKLFGGLNFYRSYTRESAYLLMHNLSKEFSTSIIETPHYSLAIREGDTKNEHYKINGGITGSILKNIPFATQINYNVENYFGFTIPKTEQQVNLKMIDFQLGYKLKQHTVYGIVKFKKEQNDFGYTTSSIEGIDTNSLVLVDYYGGISSGYGDVFGYESDLLSGFVETNASVFGAGYNFYNNNHFFNVSYTYKDEKEQYFSSTFSEDLNLAAVLYVDEHHTTMSYIFNDALNTITVNAKYSLAEGVNAQGFLNYVSNQAVTNVSSNYKQKVSVFDMSANWNKKENYLTTFGAYLDFNFRKETTIDTSTTFKELLAYSISFKLNRDFKLNKKSFLNLELGANFYNALKNDLEYSAENSSTSLGSVIPPRRTFGEDVIIYDYNYDGLGKIGGDINLNYNLKLKNKTTALVVLSYKSLSPFKEKDFNNSSNNYYNISLNFIY